jgi:hypothetical protein
MGVQGGNINCIFSMNLQEQTCPIFAVFPPSLQNYYISFSLIINRDIN